MSFRLGRNPFFELGGLGLSTGGVGEGANRRDGLRMDGDFRDIQDFSLIEDLIEGSEEVIAKTRFPTGTKRETLTHLKDIDDLFS